MISIKGVIAFVGSILIYGQACLAAEGVASMRSVHSYTATVERVETAAREKGFQVFGLSLLKNPSGQGIGLAMKTATDEVRLSNRAPLSCDSVFL